MQPTGCHMTKRSLVRSGAQGCFDEITISALVWFASYSDINMSYCVNGSWLWMSYKPETNVMLRVSGSLEDFFFFLFLSASVGSLMRRRRFRTATWCIACLFNINPRYQQHCDRLNAQEMHVRHRLRKKVFKDAAKFCGIFFLQNHFWGKNRCH